jgi:hypothetical protein
LLWHWKLSTSSCSLKKKIETSEDCERWPSFTFFFFFFFNIVRSRGPVHLHLVILEELNMIMVSFLAIFSIQMIHWFLHLLIISYYW